VLGISGVPHVPVYKICIHEMRKNTEYQVGKLVSVVCDQNYNCIELKEEFESQMEIATWGSGMVLGSILAPVPPFIPDVKPADGSIKFRYLFVSMIGAYM